MLEDLEAFDQAYGQAIDGERPMPVAPLRRRKTLAQKIGFWGANAVFMPLVATCYLTLSAEGLRQTMPVFAMRLYKLPVPGAGLMQAYDGWNRLDLSMLVALMVLVAVTYLWIRVFIELITGTLLKNRDRNPILFFLLAGIAVVVVTCDAALFYLGVQSRAASTWSGAAGYAPAAATVVFVAGLALVGAWHADYHTSETV